MTPPAASTQARSAFTGLAPRSVLGLDTYRVSKRPLRHEIVGATNNSHHNHRSGHDDSPGSYKQAKVSPAKILARGLRYNSEARAQNSFSKVSSSSSSSNNSNNNNNNSNNYYYNKPLHRAHPKGQPPQRRPQTVRRFGTPLENLATTATPSCQGRRGDRKYLRSAFSFGTVFSTAHHTAANGPEDPLHMTMTRHGRVYSKYRKFVVVECNEVSLVALPIYTCNGTGLSRKSSREIPEYVDIMDRRIPNPGPTNGVNGRLFCVADGESDLAPPLPEHNHQQQQKQQHYYPGDLLNRVGARGNACVHLTEPFSFRYSVLSRIEAQLTQESMHLLREVRATKLAASSFQALQDLTPTTVLSILGRMVHADLAEKFAQMQAESLVHMREKEGTVGCVGL